MSSQFNDADDDLPLHTRGTARDPYQRSEARHDMLENQSPDREVTLNTGIVLALFFALALLCAVFFGFGYSIGHKSAAAPIASEPDTASPADSAAASASSPKPAPGMPAAQPVVPEYVPSAGGDRAEKSEAIPAAASFGAAHAANPATEPSSVTAKPAPVVRVPPPAASATVTPVAQVAGPTAPGSSYVQIAAVSHQEDADVLVSALRRRGYTVLTRSDATDKLIHVQVGPFSNRKDAEAMRQKLASDGYNAFIK